MLTLKSYLKHCHKEEIDIRHLAKLSEDVLWQESYDIVLRCVNSIHHEWFDFVLFLVVDAK